MQMKPAVSLQQVARQQQQGPKLSLGTPSLERLCRQSIVQNLSTQNLCSILYAVELLAPALDELREPLMSCLSENLEEVASIDRDGFCKLPCSCLMHLLDRPGLVSSYIHQACLG